jgi:putative transposase
MKQATVATPMRSRRRSVLTLIHRDGPWLPHATIDAPQTPAREPNGFPGVDLGTGRHGDRCSGSYLTRYRTRQQRIRARLQAKRTSSARRLPKKRRRQEARFAAEVSHQISKNIVAEAERTGRGIAA